MHIDTTVDIKPGQCGVQCFGMSCKFNPVSSHLGSGSNFGMQIILTFIAVPFTYTSVGHVEFENCPFLNAILFDFANL